MKRTQSKVEDITPLIVMLIVGAVLFQAIVAAVGSAASTQRDADQNAAIRTLQAEVRALRFGRIRHDSEHAHELIHGLSSAVEQ